MMFSIAPLKIEKKSSLQQWGLFFLAGLSASIPFCNAIAIKAAGIPLSLIAVALTVRSLAKPTLAGAAFSSPLWLGVLWALGTLSISRLGRVIDAYYLFLSVPLLLTQVRLRHDQVRSILGLFVLSTTLAFAITLAVATSNYLRGLTPYTGRLSDLFFHEQLGYAVFQGHPTYFSLLACTSTLILIFYFPKKKWESMMLIIFFTCFVAILMARITLIIQLALLLYFVYRNFAHTARMRLLALFIAAVGFTLVYFFTIKTYDYPHRRFFQNFAENWQRSGKPGLSETDWGVTTRFALWRASWQVISTRPWTGIGNQAEKEALSLQLRANGQEFVAGLMMDSHNQYLSFLLAYGLLGSAVLLVCQLYLLQKGRSNLPYLVFILVIALVACTEGILMRFMGVSHVAVIGSVLFFGTGTIENDK